MPKATTTPTTSRRSALRGFGLATIAAGLAVPVPSQAASPPDADAELIRLCAEFDRLQHIWWSLHEEGGPLEIEDDDERAIALLPLQAQQDEIAPLIWTTPARTMDGVRAKVRSWVLWAPEILWEQEDGMWGDKWRITILRDLLEGSSAA